jgi:hypothetical protein
MQHLQAPSLASAAASSPASAPGVEGALSSTEVPVGEAGAAAAFEGTPTAAGTAG